MPLGRTGKRSAVAFVAANVRRVRVRRGLTQEKLAELLDVPTLRVQRIEGGIEDVRVSLLTALADVLGVSAAALLRTARPVPRTTGRPRKRKPR